MRITPLGQEKLEEGAIAWESAQFLAKERLGEDFERLSKIFNRLVEVLEYKS